MACIVLRSFASSETTLASSGTRISKRSSQVEYRNSPVVIYNVVQTPSESMQMYTPPRLRLKLTNGI